MAFDGITISCIQKELARALEGGRISKIAQPEPDELLITIKKQPGTVPAAAVSQRLSPACISDYPE